MAGSDASGKRKRSSMHRMLSALLLAVVFGLSGLGCSQEQSGQTSQPDQHAQSQQQSGAEKQTAAPAEIITLRYANFPPASTFPCVQMERWKEEVEKRTNGQVKVETYPGGTLLGAKDMMSGVVNGQADIGCLSMLYQPGVFPMTTGLGLPLGFTSATQASQVLFNAFEKYKPAEFSEVKVLTLFTSAPSNIMSKPPLPDLASMQGVELRGAGIASDVLGKLGAVPVSMPMPDVPESLQKGVVKGLLTSLEVLKDMNFAAYCPYATKTDFQVYPFAVIMNKNSWEKLPEDVKEVLDDLAREQAVWTGKYMDDHVTEAVEWAKQNHNLEIFTLSEEDQAAAAQALAPLTDAWKEQARAAGYSPEEILMDVEKWKALYADPAGK